MWTVETIFVWDSKQNIAKSQISQMQYIIYASIKEIGWEVIELVQ